MNKQEFINRLRAALNGRIPPEQVTENVNYYEDYINTQIRMGRSEQDVLAALGDPRLIARTIIETSGQGSSNAGYGNGAYTNSSYTNYNGSYQQNSQQGAYSGSYRNSSYGSAGSDYNEYQSGRGSKRFHLPGWLWAIIVILVMVVILNAVFSVVSYFLPILFPILLVVFLVKLFRDWLN